MSSTIVTLIEHAQVLAITKLTKALETCDDPAELRRIALAILRFKLPAAVPPAAHSESRPAAAPPPRASAVSTAPSPVSITSPRAAAGASPLTPDEVARLHRLLPHIRPGRFTRSKPDYWRSILDRLQPPNARTAAA